MYYVSHLLHLCAICKACAPELTNNFIHTIILYKNIAFLQEDCVKVIKKAQGSKEHYTHYSLALKKNCMILLLIELHIMRFVFFLNLSSYFFIRKICTWSFRFSHFKLNCIYDEECKRTNCTAKHNRKNTKVETAL